MQLKDETSNRLGFANVPLTIRDFSRNRLMISDLQLFAKKPAPIHAQVLPVVNIQGVELLPNASNRVRRAIPLFCYFEIYNLKSATDKGPVEIDIEYKIVPATEQKSSSKTSSQRATGSKRAGISLANTLTVTAATLRQLIALDVEKLQPGIYELQVAVSSRENGKRAMVRKAITIIKQ